MEGLSKRTVQRTTPQQNNCSQLVFKPFLKLKLKLGTPLMLFLTNIDCRQIDPTLFSVKTLEEFHFENNIVQLRK